MRIKCKDVNFDSWEYSLTINKFYEARVIPNDPRGVYIIHHTDTTSSYFITDDEGWPVFVPVDLFLSPSEWRQENIDKILD